MAKEPEKKPTEQQEEKIYAITLAQLNKIVDAAVSVGQVQSKANEAIQKEYAKLNELCTEIVQKQDKETKEPPKDAKAGN